MLFFIQIEIHTMQEYWASRMKMLLNVKKVFEKNGGAVPVEQI